MPEDWSTVHPSISTIFHLVRSMNRTEKEMVMANFQCVLESPFRWIAHWADHSAAGLADAFFRRSATLDRARRERMLRREYLNG